MKQNNKTSVTATIKLFKESQRDEIFLQVQVEMRNVFFCANEMCNLIESGKGQKIELRWENRAQLFIRWQF